MKLSKKVLRVNRNEIVKLEKQGLSTNLADWIQQIDSLTDAFALNSKVREKRVNDGDNQSVTSFSSTISRASQLKNLWKNKKKDYKHDQSSVVNFDNSECIRKTGKCFVQSEERRVI
jgi:hypothetical protein